MTVMATRHGKITIIEHDRGQKGAAMDSGEMAGVLVRSKRSIYTVDGAEVRKPLPTGLVGLEYREGLWTERERAMPVIMRFRKIRFSVIMRAARKACLVHAIQLSTSLPVAGGPLHRGTLT